MVEIYQPVGRKTFPLVFMLHGSAGALRVQPGLEPSSDNFGEKSFARACFTVVFPHYLEALGVESLLSQEEMHTRSQLLLRAVSQLLDEAEALPSVRRRPVFLFGQSLGGYLSVSLALNRPEIAAVSEISGGLNGSALPTRKKLPPLHVSHGEDDRNVPVAEGKRLADFWRDHGGVVSEHSYKGQTHYISAEVLREIERNTEQFFNYRHQE
jgi:predicted esterase